MYRLDFEGIRYGSTSFKAHEDLDTAVAAARGWNDEGRGAVVGKAVTVTGDAEAGYGSSGDALLGRVQQYEFDGTIGVQDTGYTELPGVSGNLPDPGAYVVVNGSGAVIPSAGANGPAKAVSVDEANFKVMVMIG